MVGDRGDLGIGMVGYAFMGRAHSQAWRSVGRFFELAFTPRLAAICGRDREQVAAAAGHQLRFFEATGEPATEGFRTIQVTRADHPYAGAWWPEGHTIGYEHTFTHEVRDLLLAIADNRDPVPSFADGLQVQEVLDAVQRSAASGAGWTEVGR
jgi:predicted dehydrogenase